MFTEEVPPLNPNLTSSVLHDIRERYPADIYGAIHLRRGDTMHTCDTSLAKMIDFLACSFAGMQDKRIALLFFSDERDKCYRTAIEGLVDALGHVSFVNLDKEINNAIDIYVQVHPELSKIQNNMYVFSVLSSIFYSSLDFRLELRRSSCGNCTKLA